MRFPQLRTFLLLLVILISILPSPVRAAEPFFKKGDVIALVGGEDMVVASEYGYLELLLTRALPDYRLRFRNLAWEGDTVFEQRRDLNFPTWEEQLDKIGATVVIAQFGQMESVMMNRPPDFEPDKEELSKFLSAYHALLERFKSGGKRRVVFVTPRDVSDNLRLPDNFPSMRFVDALMKMDAENKFSGIRTSLSGIYRGGLHRDGYHFNAAGQYCNAFSIATWLRIDFPSDLRIPANHHDLKMPRPTGGLDDSKNERLRRLIIAKNRLWFDYWRPQNWAFLAGDRTAQPSSRDHLDPSKRWFPPEREAFLPLIEAKEKEIDALAQQLAKP